MKVNATNYLTGLYPLSRDHGIVLVYAQLGRKATRATKELRLALIIKMRAACRNEIVPNLENEQWILSPFIGDEQLRNEFHQRHKIIRELASKLCQMNFTFEPGIGLLARISNALDDYVRWEENTLFPRIMEGMEQSNLNQSSKLTTFMENGRNRQTPILCVS